MMMFGRPWCTAVKPLEYQIEYRALEQSLNITTYVEFDRAGKSTSNGHISETKKATGALLGSKFSSCRGLSSTLS